MSERQESYDYVIVGGGVAAASAVGGIRSEDSSGTIAVIGSEPDKPVYRPALSKDLWLKDDETLEGSSLAGDLDDDDAVDLVTDTTVTAIDPDAHVVRLADGSSVGYGKLLLATGAEPRRCRSTPARGSSTTAPPPTTSGCARSSTRAATWSSSVAATSAPRSPRPSCRTTSQVTLVLDLEDVQEQMFPRALAASLTKAFADRGVTVVHGSVASGEDTGERRPGPPRGRHRHHRRRCRDRRRRAAAHRARRGRRPRRRQRHRRRRPPAHQRERRVRRGRRRVLPRRAPRAAPRRARRPRREVRRARRQGDGRRGRGLRLHALLLVRHPRRRLRGDRRDAAATSTWSRTGRTARSAPASSTTSRSGQVRGVLLWNVWDSVDKARELIAETGKAAGRRTSESLRGRIPFESS